MSEASKANRKAHEFQKGQKPGPGRPKGRKNEITLEIRDAIKRAFDELGGVAYLKKVGKTRPEVFLGLLAKTVPKEINATLTARYEPMPVRVEAREALPAPTAPAALPAPTVDVPFQVVEPENVAAAEAEHPQPLDL
jgi:hypothetical protein